MKGFCLFVLHRNWLSVDWRKHINNVHKFCTQYVHECRQDHYCQDRGRLWSLLVSFMVSLGVNCLFFRTFLWRDQQRNRLFDWRVKTTSCVSAWLLLSSSRYTYTFQEKRKLYLCENERKLKIKVWEKSDRRFNKSSEKAWETEGVLLTKKEITLLSLEQRQQKTAEPNKDG